jgi:hypothetical protein
MGYMQQHGMSRQVWLAGVAAPGAPLTPASCNKAAHMLPRLAVRNTQMPYTVIILYTII